MSAEAVKSFLLEGIRWIVLKVPVSIISSHILRQFLVGVIVRWFLVFAFAYFLFHPVLRAVSRRPLLNYLGMEYGDIKISPSRLKLTIKDMELLPSRCSFLQSLILSILPSANVHKVDNCIDYPESKITVQKLTIKIRVGSLAGPSHDGDPCTNTSSHPHERIFGAVDGSLHSHDTDEETKLKWGLRMMYHLIPRPIVVVKLSDVSIEIEKVYLAPEPPSQFCTTSQINNLQLPAALPLSQTGENLPTFDQDYFLNIIKSDEVVEAEKVTLFVERWIDHAVAKMKKKGDASHGFVKKLSFNKGSKRTQLNSSTTSEDLEEDPTAAGEGSAEQQTYDEKVNTWIHWATEKILHLISFELQHVSVIISGAGSEIVKKARKPHTPRESNLILAQLPKRRRALTVIGADAISLSFSPDAQCNALCCFVGLHVKVGDPIVTDEADLEVDVPYAWHMVAHPFHLVAEVKGILPFIIWAVNYDHHWTSRALGLNLSSTEIAVSLSADHLHTVLLHLDDYTDPMSTYNEWIVWLKETHCRKNLDISEHEKAAYLNNYARIKGVNAARKKGASAKGVEDLDNEKQLSMSQMKDMERRMTRYEIMSLRCFAMKKSWRIPKGNTDLEEFLCNSRSLICEKGDESRATSADVLSPFQQLYPTPLHALVTLIRENSSIFAPHVVVECFAQTLHIDFPLGGFSREKTSMSPIPSSITVSGVSFDIDQVNTLLLNAEGSVKLDSPRPFLNLSLEICAVKWDVVDNMTASLHDELPILRDRSLVGMIYMSEEAVSSKHALSLGLTIAVAPTIELEQHFGLELKTSNLVIVLNPLPLLSAIQNLIELSDLPFQSQDVTMSDLNQYNDEEAKDDGASDVGVTALGIQASIIVSVENTQLLFLVDRKKVPRGILSLNVYGINIEFESGGFSGKLALLAGPIVLRAGQIAQDQSSSHDGKMCCLLMPFQPIADVDGANFLVLGKEAKGTPNQSIAETTTSLRLDIKLGTESLFFNTSPSTIVAMFGVVSSLDPFLDWAQGEEPTTEEERLRLQTQKNLDAEEHVKFQREVLIRIFHEIDDDDSGALSEEELESVVLKLFDENNKHVGEGNQKANNAERPTIDELKRERDYLLSIMDPHRSNEISFQEMDNAFFRLANNIDDNNLIPEIANPAETLYNDHFQNTDSFLSGPKMRSIVYFDDLREYSSLKEVYRITGLEGLENSSRFPAPSLWRQGKGIELFWDLYTSETGCSNHSLNGQSMNLVQRKLVRTVGNYEFAKFCWKTLVQQGLYDASDADKGRVVTHWLLDKDSKARIKSGGIDRLVRHVDTEVTKEKKSKEGTNINYDVHAVAVVDSAVVRFGSSHIFANPLFEARFSQISTNASALLSSQTGWFVPEKEFINADDDGNQEDCKGNQVHFQSNISAMYLNTKHNHMECFLEPYPSFGSVIYKVFPEDSSFNGDDDDKKAASFSIHLDCPRFLNINTSRSFFETASVLTKVISQSDPETFRTKVLDRDVSYIRNFWDMKDPMKSGLLSREDTLAVLTIVVETHWKDEVAGLTPNEKHHFVLTFCNLAEKESGGDGLVSFDSLIAAFKIYTSRCYFSGSKEIQLKNNIGRELKATTKSNIEEHCMQFSNMSESDYQQLLDTFHSIEDGTSCAIPLSGRLTLVTPGYKLIDGISVSPYQSLMFPLKHRKKGSKRKSRRRSASGFSPYLTVVPKSDSLDSVTLDVRTSVHIRTEIPIKIRIVRLGKSPLNFRSKHGTKLKIDLAKKNLIPALRRVVEGAPIVYEKSGIKEGDAAPLPLDVLDSSHFHALLIQPLTERENNSWRDPVLLTKDFLFNPTNIGDVTRCHCLSGIVVRKERLNVHLSDKHRNTPTASDTKRSILRRTAWDTTIQVVPFFLLTNSLTFPIVVRTWQTSNEIEDELLWDEPLLPTTSADGIYENASSDDDPSSATPSIRGRRTTPEDTHLSSGAGSSDHYSQDHVAIGQTLRLSGVNLRESLFLQVSQRVNASEEEVKFLWTNPLRVQLSKMRTGVNRKGLSQLPTLVLDLGDNCDCLVDVTLEGGTRVPVCTIYSPYWIMNKTGSKLEYKISGQSKRYLDSGYGGLPVMIHGSKSEHTNDKYQNASRAISVCPLELPSQTVAKHWWDEASNGLLVLQKSAIEEKGQSLVDWSDSINLDAAGTYGEINCNKFIFNVSIDSLAGAFHRSNLISFTPRFVVKNMLHIAISIVPLFGGLHDAIRKASQLRQKLSEQDQKRKLDLGPGESMVLFNFHDISHGIEKPYRWVAFCVNAARFGATFKCKWHLIPVDLIDETHYYGEHDGSLDTMCGILEAKVHSSDGGTLLVPITHAPVPPFLIENRSNHQYLRFVQDDADAVVFELPPMHSCAYTWDSPLAKKKLRALVISKAESKSYQLEEILKVERNDEEILQNKDRDGVMCDETVNTVDSDDESTESETIKEPLLQALQKGAGPDSRALKKTPRYRSPRKRAVFTLESRSYDMKKVGNSRDLPCPSASGHSMMSSNLFTNTRIIGGTKILSFSDSTWLADQVHAGMLRKGGDFKTSLCEMNMKGFGLYIMDDFPREVMAVVVRDIQLHKPMGSIKTTARVRHFQVDAMLPNARYPIIIQPSPLGVDRRDPKMKGSKSSDLIVPDSVDKRDCFWMRNEEKPIPVLEMVCEYVPQRNMTWVPSLNIFVCPMKLQLDVDYILRISGMVVNSIFKYQDDAGRNLTATSHANSQLKYVTRGELNICRTYIEKLYISPLEFDIELNIKSDDPDHDEEGDSSLTLHSIAQTTNSAAVAGLLSWVINVGANFAHVSPTFRYSPVTYTDRYCDIFDLLQEIAKPYFIQTIKQGYKVVFSMQLFGDPSHLLQQWKTGFSDLLTVTRDEVAAGGKGGVGRGAGSLLQNVVGGTCFSFGKFTGGVADTLDAVTTNDMTSDHLKPKSASSDGKHPDNAVDGVVQGTTFLGQTLVHGFAGLIGNPYRGAKTGTATGVAKGVASGVTGLVTAPLVGALGFAAKTADGLGASTQCLELGVIDARCRPARTVPWGRPMSDNGLSYLKAIGIRVHTVRYQNIRRRVTKKVDTDSSHGDDVTSKEYKRIRAAEERRKNPPRKLVSIMHEKDKYHYITAPTRPKLLSDEPGNLVLSHYAVTFEETLILRSSDLQLGDVVAINFWNHRGLKSSTTRAKPLGVCKLSVGDIYSSVLHFYNEQLRRKESNLSHEDITKDSLIIPAPQDCALFRPCKKQQPDHKDIFDAIGEELASIEKSEEDKFAVFDSDSSESDSDTSFLGGEGKAKEDDPASIVKANERLFGSISLSFFPIPW